MAISDIYTADSGLISISSTTQTSLIAFNTPSTKRVWIVGVRLLVGNTTAAAGNNVLFTLARITNTPSTTNTVNIRKQDASAPNSLIGTTAMIATWTTTAPTLGDILSEWELPQASGSAWEDFPPTGYEWGIAASSGVAVAVTTSVATATPLGAQLVWSE